MNFYVGVTDYNWFDFLRQELREDINFWKPSGQRFAAIKPGDFFLFKLRKPQHRIVGVGQFASQIQLRLPQAWEVFAQRNGAATYQQFAGLIHRNRHQALDADSEITCIVLNAPVFFREEDWIPAPSDWADGIVQGKGYSDQTPVGRHVWAAVQATLPRYPAGLYAPDSAPAASLVLEDAPPQYGLALTKMRLGQGAFRATVMEAYDKRCAISGEKTLPVLDAAHIKPYAEAGPSVIGNGLLLRSDLHTLFDKHYLTVNADNLVIEVSPRIRKEFSNGKEYYRFHGQALNRPKDKAALPAQQFLQYHNERFRG
jgi:putative restriction endonuclease